MTDLSALTPGTWTIDPAHSTVGFVARHLMITKVRGRFTDFSGSIEVGENPLQSHVVATVNWPRSTPVTPVVTPISATPTSSTSRRRHPHYDLREHRHQGRRR